MVGATSSGVKRLVTWTNGSVCQGEFVQRAGLLPPRQTRLCEPEAAISSSPRSPIAAAAPSQDGIAPASTRGAWFTALLSAALLAGCLGDDGSLDGASGPGGSPSEVLEILERTCGDCHGANSTGDGGFDEVADLKALVDLGLVVPNDPEGSYLLRRMEFGDMPPLGSDPRPTAGEIATLRQWIAAGARAVGAGGADGGDATLTPQVEFAQTIRLMADDLSALPAEDRQFQRYVLLGNLRNAGGDADLIAKNRAAIDLMMNSLSFEAVSTPALPVDEDGLVLRLDLRDYDWVGPYHDRWITLTRDLNHVRPNLADPIRSDLPELELLERLAGTDVPWIRGDWLLASASEPPLYYDLLGMPDNARDISHRMMVDVDANLDAGEAARAGFSNSGVSRSNRMIERHEGPAGAFWWSYDFASSEGDHNLFEFPLNFEDDGGEAIFTLPNGLQAFAIVNTSGVRIDVAPTSIVNDANNPDEPAIKAGISCFSCHGEAGILPKVDRVRPYVEANAAAFGDEVVAQVQALHPTEDEMYEIQLQDRADYASALAAAGLDWTAADALAEAVDEFNDTVDLERAAADLWLTPEALLEVLDQVPPHELLALRLIAQPAGHVEREVFESAVDRLGDFIQYTD